MSPETSVPATWSSGCSSLGDIVREETLPATGFLASNGVIPDEVRVNFVTTNRRFHWILVSVLLLLGIFPASVASRRSKGFHAVQRAASRAIGAHDSLSATTRIKRPLPPRTLGFIVLALLLNPFTFRLSRVGRVYRVILRFRCSRLWPPSLLFRPPPVPTVA